MLVIALFRNFNQGQAGTPRAAELASLFRAVGAVEARPIRANGTVVVRARDPQLVVERVRHQISATSSWSDVVIVRPVEWMDRLAERLVDCPAATEVAFFDAAGPFPQSLPWRPDRGRITVQHADDRHAICTNDQERTSFATPTLERLLEVPVTSRGADTVIRAVRAARRC